MGFTRLISLFEGAQIMTFIAYFFIFNIGLIFIETLIGLITSKKRRWKDTGVNFLIFITNKLKKRKLWKNRFKIIFGNLSWRPDYFKKQPNNLG
jgi:hypothetical protein